MAFPIPIRIVIDDPNDLWEAETNAPAGANPAITVPPSGYWVIAFDKYGDFKTVRSQSGPITRYDYSIQVEGREVNFYLRQKPKRRLVARAITQNLSKLTHRGRTKDQDGNIEIEIVWKRGTLEQASE